MWTVASFPVLEVNTAAHASKANRRLHSCGGSVWLVSVSVCVSLSYFLLPASSPVSPLSIAIQPQTPASPACGKQFPWFHLSAQKKRANLLSSQTLWECSLKGILWTMLACKLHAQESLFPAGPGRDSLKYSRHLISVCWTNEPTSSLSIHFPSCPHHSIENTRNNVMDPIPVARSSGLFWVLVLADSLVAFGMLSPCHLKPKSSVLVPFFSLRVFIFHFLHSLHPLLLFFFF